MLLGAQERYRVVRFVGQGGMGRVYEARRERDGRPAAVKVLRADRAATNGPEVVARFRQEAAAASSVGHVGIVETLGFEHGPDGSVVIAMELLEGETLEDWMSREGTLGEALGYVASLCDALHAAHEAGIIHRDLKPANLFLHRESDGTIRPTIVDFGLAKVSLPDHTQIETAAGTVLGTPYYLAPERALGKPLDRRADLYSIGVLLYELITGALPFDADNFMAILEGHVRLQPLDPRQAAPERSIPDAVSSLAMRLLAKDPQERLATAADVAAALRTVSAEQPQALAACPTGPRTVANADDDTMSLLNVAARDTTAGLVASAHAATVAPSTNARVAAPTAATVAPGDAVAAGEPIRQRPKPAAGVMWIAVPVVGLAVAAGVWWGLRASEPKPGPPEHVPAAAPPAANAPEPAATPAVDPTPAPAPVVEVAQPKPRPKPAAAPDTAPGSGTKAAATKPRRKPSAPKPKPKPQGAPAEPPPASDPTPSGLPAFKDDVYED